MNNKETKGVRARFGCVGLTSACFKVARLLLSKALFVQLANYTDTFV